MCKQSNCEQKWFNLCEVSGEGSLDGKSIAVWSIMGEKKQVIEERFN